jgi:lipid A ethanolaminephosphotransferase
VPQSHDDLYHTVLGLLDVTSPTYDRALDTFAACRKKAP